MRVSVFARDRAETARQRTPRRDARKGGGPAPVAPARESVDEQIESLLAGLQETDVVRAESYPVADQPVATRRRRRARRPRDLVSRYDLLFTATAVVLGIAVGVLTVLLLNG